MKFNRSISSSLILHLLFNFSIAQSQELKFALVTNPNGKPIGKINAISQDPHGYMWLLGSGEKCIYRFDGNRMISFRHDDSISNSLSLGNKETIYTDDSGMVWIGGMGLDKYDPATGIFKHFHSLTNDTNTLSSNAIYSILKDKQGRLWIGTDKGLDQLDEKTGKFIHYRNQAGNNKSISSNVIWRLYEDRQGVIWVATGWPWNKINPEDGGLNRLEKDGSFTRFIHDPKDPQSLIDNKIAAVFEDSRGTFWVGTSGDGLHTMDRKRGKFQRLQFNPDKPDQLSRPAVKKGEVNDKITFITEDSTGTIWIGTMYSGINRYDPETKLLTHLEHSNGFPDSTSWTICVSKEGVVWIATENANLYRFDPFEKPISSVQIGTIPMNFLEDVDGFLWVGTRGNGLYKFNQQNQIIRQFKNNPSMPNGITHNNIMGLFQKTKETLWVGTHGLRMLNTVTDEFARTDVTAINDSLGVSFICTDKQGIFWFGIWGGGLARYNPKDASYRIFLHDESDSTSINSNEVLYIMEDKLGFLWITTSQGINLLNPEKGEFKHYLEGFWTSSIYEDSRGNIWSGSFNGLYQYNRNEDRFTLFFDEQSELSTFITGGITEDESKNIWFLNQKGIVKLNPLTKEIFIYGSKYGVNPQELTTWAKIYKNKKGQIFMPHGSGYYTFSPEELNNNRKLNIIITELFVNSLPVLPGKQNFLKKQIEETSELQLKYNQNSLAFNFSIIDYREPELTRYYTMLENYDNTWREIKGEKSSYYINIQPGRYLFHIKAYTTDGMSAEKVLSIHIQPPWWKTWWAYSLYGLLLISALITGVRIQKQRIIQKERQKAQVVELAQAKEIEKAYHELRSTQSMLIQSEKMASLGELTAGIAHEIQNPLNFVNNFSDVNQELISELKEEIEKGNLGEVKEIAENLKENEAKINYHGKRADSIVKGMLQHSRTSTGQKEPADINALADEYLRLAYHGLRGKDKSFNANLQTDFDPGIGKINIIIQDIGRVLLNLYNNAFYAVSEKNKLAGSGYEPTVTVSTRKIDRKIEVTVSDNGIGIPAQIREKIFQPFFTTKPTGQGTGLGLSLSYDIVKAHGGNCRVESRENNSLLLLLNCPFKRLHLQSRATAILTSAVKDPLLIFFLILNCLFQTNWLAFNVIPKKSSPVDSSSYPDSADG